MNLIKFSEFVGIIFGDGNIYAKYGNYRITITGHSTEDLYYLNYHVKHLIKELFSKEASLWKHKNKKALALAFYSKEIISKLKLYGLNPGPKTMRIPSFIKTNKRYIARFLRGIFDTDFCILFTKRKYNYPLFTTNFSNKTFVIELKKLLLKFEISANVYFLKKKVNGRFFNSYRIDIYGKSNLNKIISLIGLRNPKHLTKISVWKKLGYCYPKTTIQDRLILLNKKTYK